MRERTDRERHRGQPVGITQVVFVVGMKAYCPGAGMHQFTGLKFLRGTLAGRVGDSLL